jgi:RNA-binding protein YlmH
LSLYEHYRKEEHPFVDQVLEWKSIASDQFRPKLTDFLDPRQQEIAMSLIGQNDDIRISFWGGQDQAERKRGLLYPDYFEPGNGDFELSVYEINYPVKFAQLEHRKILGALMNVGLKREKFGDILTDGTRFQVILADEVADFVTWNFTSAGKTKVSLEKVSNEKDIIQMEQEFLFSEATVSSLRLDTVLAEAFNISRSKVKPFVQNGDVKLNWKTEEDPSSQVEVKDVISLRGKGRCHVVSIDGQTKKGKWRITIGFPR